MPYFSNFVYAAASLLSLASYATSSPVEQSTHDILTSVYGPLNTWCAIKAIDLYPNGTFDGHPVNDSIIFAYEPPSSAGPEKHALVSSLLAEKSALSRRQSYPECYGSGAWVPQLQLFSAKDTYCQDAAGHLDGSGLHQQYKDWWQASDGTWNRFTNQDGDVTTVWFYQRWANPESYNIQACQIYYSILISGCRGSNPDSAGGVYHSDGNEFGVDPRE
ncbi:hypothetical protein F5884DRAFT_857339 [Xylogone sp. PMI_703]|nr:hypothetical protein F5884DRAFT_857339 [Xylogone sp. PMI_703]